MTWGTRPGSLLSLTNYLESYRAEHNCYANYIFVGSGFVCVSCAGFESLVGLTALEPRFAAQGVEGQDKEQCGDSSLRSE
jgi:hypothetical protein